MENRNKPTNYVWKKIGKTRLTLRVRFVSLVVLGSLVAGVTAGFFVIRTVRDSVRDEVLNDNLGQAILTADYTSRYMQKIQENVDLFVKRFIITQAVLDNEPERIQDSLTLFTDSQSALESIGILDEKGIQRAFSNTNVTVIGQSYTDSDYFQQVSATHQPYLGVAVEPRANGSAVVPYAVPVLDNQDKLRGILVANISTSGLSDSIVNVHFSSKSQASIIDLRNGGVVIAHANPTLILTPVSAENEAVSRLLDGESAAVETTSSTGEPDLIGFSLVSGLPWGIMIITPSAAALAMVGTLTNNIILINGFIVMSAAIIGAIIILGITGPIRRLVEATEEIGRGNLDYKVPPAGNDEIGDLSHAFGRMAQELKQTLVSRDELVIEVRERMRAEQALAHEIERRIGLFEQTPVGIVIHDPKSLRFIEFNRVAHEQLGYTREEFSRLGIPDIEVNKTPEEIHNRNNNIQLNVRSDFDAVHHTKQGKIRNVQVTSQAINLGGQVVYQSIWQDITERKRAEKEALLLREEAEKSSRLAAVGEMAAGIAHEINNPLTSVIGFSELLMDADTPPNIKKHVKIINNGSKRVKEIVKRMLTFARQTKPLRTSTGINGLIDNTLEIRDYVLKTANIKVVKNYDPEPLWTSVDPGQMQQVFLNIIVNAEYAMKKAHGRGTFTITTKKTDGHIRISFKDDGTGMDEATKEKLFHPFFTTKDVGEGTGLGLSLSRSIILEHGGTIEVESESGKGADFIITLPLTATDDEIVHKPVVESHTLPENFKPSRILVVDDEVDIGDLVTTILADNGHTVDVTVGFKGALRKLEGTSYDVILMDVRMPGMSGMELYELIIKTHPQLENQFIFITGDTSDANTRAFLEQNNLSYITKPFDRETLLQKVNALL